MLETTVKCILRCCHLYVSLPSVNSMSLSSMEEGRRKGGSPLAALLSQRFCSLKLQVMLSPDR